MLEQRQIHPGLTLPAASIIADLLDGEDDNMSQFKEQAQSSVLPAETAGLADCGEQV